MSTARSLREELTDEDRQFLEAFGAGTLDPGEFHHRDHVHLAWLMLGTEPLIRAIDLFTAGLRRLAAAAGRPERYHETMTWALLLLIHERRERFGGATTWESFAESHAELLEWPSPLLRARYRDETLASDLARRTFILPNKE